MKRFLALASSLAFVLAVGCTEKSPEGPTNPSLSSGIIYPYSSYVDPFMSSYVDPGLSSAFIPIYSSYVDPGISSWVNPFMSSSVNPMLSSYVNPYLSSAVIIPVSSAVLMSSSAAIMPVSSSSYVDPSTQVCGGKMPAPISGGQAGWGSRYWDCCKPSCSWHENTIKKGTPYGVARNCSVDNQESACFTPMDGGTWFKGTVNACESGGVAFACNGNAPWAVCDNLSYGFAAGHSSVPCGKCYQLDFTGTSHNGNVAGQAQIKGKSMIVMVSNIGYDVQVGQFDLMIPGGGVGAFASGCRTQWGTTDQNLLGIDYGGFLGKCQQKIGHSATLAAYKTCVMDMCTALFGAKPERADLYAGCKWYVDWMNVVDNPNFVSKEVECPAELVAKYRSTISN